MMKKVVFFALVAITAAQRDGTLSVLDSLRQLQPAYRDLQKFLVNTVADAKHNSTDAIYDFHSTVVSAKEVFLRAAIAKEVKILQQINNQAPPVEADCLDRLRVLVDNNINVAGYGFSKCILEADSQLTNEINQIYVNLSNGTSFANISLYDVFKGQNVFDDPQAIISKLQLKLLQLQQPPAGLVAQLSALVDQFKTNLGEVHQRYQSCLTTNDGVYQQAIDVVQLQLQLVCSGQLITDENLEPTTPDNTVQPGSETIKA